MKPRIGRSRCLRWPWSRSSPLLRDLEERCSDSGSTPRSSWRIALGFISRDAGRSHAGLSDGSFDEALRCYFIAPITEVHVHRLPVLVYRPVEVRSPPVQAPVRLVRPRLRTDRGHVGVGGRLKEGQESLDPAIDRGVIDHHSALPKPFDHVGIPEAIADTPAHGEANEIIGEVMPMTILPPSPLQQNLQRSRSDGHPRSFLSAFGPIREHFCPRGNLLRAGEYSTARLRRFQVWYKVTGLGAAA